MSEAFLKGGIFAFSRSDASCGSSFLPLEYCPVNLAGTLLERQGSANELASGGVETAALCARSFGKFVVRVVGVIVALGTRPEAEEESTMDDEYE